MPQINIDFWDVIGENDRPFNLLPILQRAGGLSVRQRMVDRGSEHTDYLASVASDSQQATGLAARIRKENLPERGNLQTGRLDPLPLTADEGVAEEVHFLYDQSLRVWVIQRNRMFRSSSVADLVSTITRSRFFLEPKLREDAWRRFGEMQIIGNLELKLVTPGHHPNFSETIPSIGSLLDDASDRIGAATVELIFSMGRAKKQSLNLDLIRSITRLFRRRQTNVAKMAVKGRRNEEERPEVIDFIRDRLVYSGEVSYSGRQLDREQCQRLLRRALNQHRNYLRSLL